MLKKSSVFFDLKVLVLFSFIIQACGSNQPETKVGNQIWMSENLKTEEFQNGDKIPEAKNFEEWGQFQERNQPAWCYFNFDPNNNDKFGKLYNWAAVHDPRQLAPKGWRIPSHTDWDILIDFLGVNTAGYKMKSKDGWPANGNNNTNGDNSINFNGVCSGQISYSQDNKKGFFFDRAGSFWETNPNGYEAGRTLCHTNRLEKLNINNRQKLYTGEVVHDLGFSVRCVKDN